MPSRAAKDLIYRAKGMYNHMASKLSGMKRAYGEAFKRGEQRPSVIKTKQRMNDFGYNP